MFSLRENSAFKKSTGLLSVSSILMSVPMSDTSAATANGTAGLGVEVDRLRFFVEDGGSRLQDFMAPRLVRSGLVT